MTPALPKVTDTAVPSVTTSDRRVMAEIVVARRYLDHGFVDAAMRMFARRAANVTAADWQQLVARLLERGRVNDAVDMCRLGDIPLPRQELLTLGDRQLRRKDIDGAIHHYELAGADRERWSALVDVLTRLPGRELHALEMAERHLLASEKPAVTAAA
jgi:hypothetical protein